MIKKLIILCVILYTTLNAIYIREDNSGKPVVLDTTTNLIWKDYSLESKSWKDAISACEDLEMGTYEDWRLPNYVELYSIVDLSKKSPAQSDIFQERSIEGYWTSTVFAPGYAWAIDFELGSNQHNYSLDEELKVRCVHTR